MTPTPRSTAGRPVSRRHVLTAGALAATSSLFAGCLDAPLAGTAGGDDPCSDPEIKPGGNLNERELRNCDFSGMELQAIRFRFADLTGSNFDDTRLYMMNADRATFDDTSFRNADVASVRFSYTSLRNADFRGADLTRAEMWETDLTGADLTGAVLDGTSFGGATMPDGSTYESGSEIVRTP